MRVDSFLYKLYVHCRVGSLEIVLHVKVSTSIVHCRVGSLEMIEGLIR